MIFSSVTALKGPYKYLLGVLLFVLVTGAYLAVSHRTEDLRSYFQKFRNDDTPSPPAKSAPTKMLVVSSMVDQNTSWVHELDWEHSIYMPEPPRQNKGHEANLYLSYIIENYDDLRDITAFTHHHRTAWHIDAPDKSIVQALSHLRLSYVEQEGYVSLRCGNIPGACDDFSRPFAPKEDDRTMPHYPAAYEALFNATAPQFLASPCCGQFAVTKSQIRRRSREEYKHFHQWLMETPLEDYVTGRVFEYSWHIIFGKDAIHCPNTKACWCNTYGWCEKGTFFV